MFWYLYSCWASFILRNYCNYWLIVIATSDLCFAERKYFVEVVGLLDKQVQEMKLMTNAIRRLEGNGALPFNILGWPEKFPMLWIFYFGFHLWLANRARVFVNKACGCVIGELVMYNPLRVQHGGSCWPRALTSFIYVFNIVNRFLALWLYQESHLFPWIWFHKTVLGFLINFGGIMSQIIVYICWNCLPVI